MKALSEQLSDLAARSNYMAEWLQDDWKATPKLTVNLGLRWDLAKSADLKVQFDRMSNAAGSTASCISLSALRIGALAPRRVASRPSRSTTRPWPAIASAR